MSAQALMLVRLAPGVRPGRGFDSPVHSRPKAKGSERSLLLLGGGGRGPRFNPSLRDYMQQNNQTCGRLLTVLSTPS